MANNDEKNEGIIKKLGSLIFRAPASENSEDNMETQYFHILDKYKEMQVQLTAVIDKLNISQTIMSENPVSQTPQFSFSIPPPLTSGLRNIFSTNCTLIKEALQSIREYHETTNPHFWLQTVSKTMDKLLEIPQLRYGFTKRLIAQRIKGKAFGIIERVPCPTMSEIAAALKTAFSLTDLDYDQLSSERNNTRQVDNENTQNYIRRYEDLTFV